MKAYLSILFTLLFAISCGNYQKSPLNLDSLAPKAVLAADSNLVLEKPTNDLGLSKNFQVFLDRFLVLKQGEKSDTLFDYDKYRNQRSYGEILELRQNLHTIIAKQDLKELTKDEKIAFLINTYNFFAIETISDNYFTPNGERLKSILDIESDAFKQKIHNIGGLAYSLDDIEKVELKSLLTFSNGGVDARFHFAVICAANGCPILMKEAYTSSSLQQQLTNATVEGLKLKRNLDQDKGTLTKLFSWYSFDFNNHSEQGIKKVKSYKEFISMYTTGVNISKLDENRNNEYDWRINKVVNESDQDGFYSDMQTFLDQFVSYIPKSSIDTLVDYEKLYNEKDTLEVKSLRTRLYKSLEEVNLNDLSKSEKTAFLTNAYNFLAIETVLKNYRSNGTTLDSIANIGGRDSFSAFRAKSFNIGGTLMSLDDIEKVHLKSNLTFSNGSIDARYHFTVICAAKGCPILKKQAYIPSIIQSQFTSATVDSLKEPRNFFLDNSGSLNLTSLFDWYKSDFEQHSEDGQVRTQSTANFLSAYIDGLKIESTGSPTYINYDWNLNKL